MTTDRPTWIRWQHIPPTLLASLLAGNHRLFLALHAHNGQLAILAAPSCDRYILTARATHGRITTRKVIMTIIRDAPTCPASPSNQRPQK